MVTRKVSEPVQDAVKAYLELAFGLTEATKKKAEKTVKRLAKELSGKSGATAAQLQGLAEELVATGTENREAVARLVRVEMDRALSRVGLATADEVSSLVDRVASLERQLRDAKAQAPAAAKLAEPRTDSVVKLTAETTAAAPARKTVAKKAVKSVAPAAAKATPAKKAAAGEVPTAAKKAVKKVAPRKATS